MSSGGRGLPQWRRGDRVRSRHHGLGVVEAATDATVIAWFAGVLQSSLPADLERIASPQQQVLAGGAVPLEVVTRVQAEAIRSVNTTWGVFARSRIQLLPHQLWVCRKVVEQWPTRWMVADDVGLGKTIEAGLIVSGLLMRQRVQRLLVICPASLVDQWLYRLRTMFGMRCAPYVSEADTTQRDFWNTHPHVVASMHTLRKDTGGRHQRLVEAEPWDLLVVDEAHHLNADEQAGPTLGYKLIERLQSHQRIRSMVFFTGTPHRGKAFGFFALMKLLRPELFDPRQPHTPQYARLREVMIRNNKQSVTDTNGKRLFQKPVTQEREYHYSDAEKEFYGTLTEFIASGKAYANRLGGSDGRAVMLVLIAMQKLASSSIAAIRRALTRRLARRHGAAKQLQQLRQVQRALMGPDAEFLDLDERAGLEEEIAELAESLVLMEDEKAWLEQLVGLADGVKQETKIERILAEVAQLPNDASVLFFTEYKATQSLLMSRLLRQFGDGCCAFINGDGRAEDIVDAQGRSRTVTIAREDAAAQFNAGKVRFLVSTEAAGEGIDLQESCHRLVHVDLPWNPMRLHQRVGRLNRYGQHRQVFVTYFRNPDTVEDRIWTKLQEKLAAINQALGQAMDQPEDMLELVLGMASDQVFTRLYAEAPRQGREGLSTWFDAETASFGGQDMLATVRDLVGNAARFDFGRDAPHLPQVDLPDLKPFFVNMLTLNRRRVQEERDGLSFKTPEAWSNDPGVRGSYQALLFDRHGASARDMDRIIGVGHRLMDHALDQGGKLDALAAFVPSDIQPHPLVVCEVRDQVSTPGSAARAVLCALDTGTGAFLQDWQVLQRLNAWPAHRWAKLAPGTPSPPQGLDRLIERAQVALKPLVGKLDVPMQAPDVQVLALFWPDGNVSLPSWWSEANRRRVFLIDKQLAEGRLSAEEAKELAGLERRMGRHLDKVAPLPWQMLEALRRAVGGSPSQAADGNREQRGGDV